jgi:zinc D-Ala-D-Ala dipeptidase
MRYIFFLLFLALTGCSNEKAVKSPTSAVEAESGNNTAGSATTDAPATEAKPTDLQKNDGEAAGAQPADVVEETPTIAQVVAAPEAGVPPTVLKNAIPINSAENFVDVIALDPTIALDVRYATANNFTKAQIYDCPACLLRPEAAQKIVKIHQSLRKQGLGLKMFDCYRPRPYQQRLWDKVPNPDYVTPPAKGSMHSRGAAVDLTIVNAQGDEMDMGTEYDFFGKEAHFDYTNLSAKVLENRQMLRRVMENNGFQGIRTEWWHFSFKGKDYPLSDYVWPCK